MCVKVRAARLVFDGRAEEALRLLASYYGVPVPALRVGLPRGCRRALGCYVASRRTIYVRSSAEYRDPFVVLHEFYHHLRRRLGRHRGTERHADEYALEALRALGEGACLGEEDGGGHGEGGSG